MKTKTISVERLFSLPGYQNIKIGIVAELEETDVPTFVTKELIKFINEEKAKFDKQKEFERKKSNALYKAEAEVRKLKSMEYDDCSNKDTFDPEDDLPF